MFEPRVASNRNVTFKYSSFLETGWKLIDFISKEMNSETKASLSFEDESVSQVKFLYVEGHGIARFTEN